MLVVSDSRTVMCRIASSEMLAELPLGILLCWLVRSRVADKDKSGSVQLRLPCRVPPSMHPTMPVIIRWRGAAYCSNDRDNRGHRSSALDRLEDISSCPSRTHRATVCYHLQARDDSQPSCP